MRIKSLKNQQLIDFVNRKIMVYKSLNSENKGIFMLKKYSCNLEAYLVT